MNFYKFTGVHRKHMGLIRIQSIVNVFNRNIMRLEVDLKFVPIFNKTLSLFQVISATEFTS